MHIHPSYSNSDIQVLQQLEESTAVKIQSGYHVYRVRKQVNCQGYGSDMSSTQSTVATTSDSHHLDDQNIVANSMEADRCATKIQAGVRGFLVRKKQKTVMEAATKIQAGFRGFKARKEMSKRQ